MVVFKRFRLSSAILATFALSACVGDQLFDPYPEVPLFGAGGNVPPVAVDDVYGLGTIGGTLTVAAGDGTLAGPGTDNLGSPVATLVSFGGADVGGVVTSNAAGSTKALPDGGSLTVNADGSFELVSPTSWTGCRRFRYRIQNAVGRRSDAKVTIVIGTTTGVACTDRYFASGNIAIEVGAEYGVLTNDPEGTLAASVQGSPANIGQPTPTKASGRNGVMGSVTLNGDGSFLYEPPPGFWGTDWFSYASCSATACVRGVRAYIYVRDGAWFIDNSSAGSNLGTFSNPFLSIADFNSANGTTKGPALASLISLRTGTGTYSEADGINLLDYQRLVGEGVQFRSGFIAKAFSVPSYQTFSLATNAHPVIEVTGANNNGVDLALNNRVRGFNVGNTNATPGTKSYGMSGSNVGNLLVSSVSITGLGGALDIGKGNLGTNVTFGELSSMNAPDRALRLTALTGTLTVLNPASAIIDANAGQSVRIGGGSLSLSYPGTVRNDVRPFHLVEMLNTLGGSVEFSGTVATINAGSRAILLRNVASDVTFANVDIGAPGARVGGQSGIVIEGNSTGTFTFENVDVFTAINAHSPVGESIGGIRVDNTVRSGRLNITNGRFDADGGPAIDIELTQLNLASVEPISVNSDADAVRLVDVRGSVNLTGPAGLTTPTSHAVNIAHSSGTLAVNIGSLAISSPGGDGVRLTPTGTGTLCLNMESNAFTGSNTGFVLSNSATSTFRLQDFVGNGGVAADVEAWIGTKGNTGTTSVSGTFASSAVVCVP